MRWILVLAMACNSAATSAGLDATHDPATCKATLEASIDRSCAAATDCVLVHSSDCCGTVVIAVKKGTESGFAAVETQYETCLSCGGRGCFHADLAEDGGAPQAGQSIVATCAAQRCKATVQ